MTPSDPRPPWAQGPTHAGEPTRTLGAAAPRIDGQARIRGRATFVDDLHPARCAHAVFVRSPHPRARLVSVDTTAARALPGVLDALVGDDLPVRYGPIPVARDETALAVGEVRYVGEPVVCVCAVDEATARAAARLVRVVYEPLPAVTTLEDALADGAPLVHAEGRKPSNVLRRVHQSYGDVDTALRDAAVVVEREFFYGGSTHVPLEPHAAVALVEPDGRLCVHASTQNPHYLHKDLARALSLPEDRVRVVKPAVGAGYGGKCDPTAVEICAAALALRLDRPVKIVLTREEVFYQHRGRHPTRMNIRLGLRADGTIAGIDFRADAAGGAYASYGVVTAYYLGVFLTLPYRVDHVRFEAKRVYTHEPACGPKRGHGAIQPRLAVECALDEACARLGRDPGAVRLHNAVRDGHETVNGLKVGTAGLDRCLHAVLDASGWQKRRDQMPPGRGLGLAASAYMCGALHPVYDDEMPQSAAWVTLDRSGAVTLFTGAADLGQGSSDVLARLVAERLGLRPVDVRVIDGDTAITPVDLGSYSSRVTFMAGNAALAAADAARERVVRAVAEASGVPEAEVALDGGEVHVGAPSTPGRRVLPWRDAVRLTEERLGPVVGVGGYKPAPVGSRFRRQSVGPSPAYSFTAQVAEVEVDADTGFVRVLKVWCAHDLGRALNPASCEAQIEGCVAMGVGEALYEAHRTRDGRLESTALLEYRVPLLPETPEIVPILVETHEPLGPYGAKEVGEGPQLPTAPAILNAVAHAVGVRPVEVPLTPDRLLALLDARGRPC